MFDVQSILTSKQDLSIVALWANVSYLFLSSTTLADDCLTVESNACSLLAMCWCSARPLFVLLFVLWICCFNAMGQHQITWIHHQIPREKAVWK